MTFEICPDFVPTYPQALKSLRLCRQRSTIAMVDKINLGFNLDPRIVRAARDMERRAVIGARIAECRVSLGLTQARLASQLGVPIEEIADPEAGRKFASVRFLMDLAALAGVTVGWLICEREADTSHCELALNGLEGRLLAAFSTIDDEGNQQFILRMVEQMSARFAKSDGRPAECEDDDETPIVLN